MSANHTPGPWRVIIDDTGGPFSGWPSIDAPEHIDASVIHRAGFKQEYWGDWSQREALANARLIAAAPDLLAALKNFAYPGPYTGQPTQAEMIAEARAAITKATGQ